MPIIFHETFIHAPIQCCFDIARTVETHSGKFLLTRQYPVSGIVTGAMGLGDEVTWETLHFGLKQHLTSRITHMNPPFFFQDDMLSGAFESFTHRHLFKEENSGTLMIDQFIYQSPFGRFGKIADTVFLEKYMRKFIQLQADKVKEIAELES